MLEGAWIPSVIADSVDHLMNCTDISTITLLKKRALKRHTLDFRLPYHTAANVMQQTPHIHISAAKNIQSKGRAPISECSVSSRYTQNFQTQCFQLTSIVDEIVISTSLKSFRTVRDFTHKFINVTVSLVFAFIPTLIRLILGTFSSLTPLEHLVAWCYFVLATRFVSVHVYFLINSCITYIERRQYMAALSAMLLKSVSWWRLPRSLSFMGSDHHKNKTASSDLDMFPTSKSFIVELPLLNYTNPTHLSCWIRMRDYLQTFKISRLTKYSIHLLIVVGSSLGFSLALLFYAPDTQTVNPNPTGGSLWDRMNGMVLFYTAVYLCITMGVFSSMTVVSVSKVNQEEKWHIITLFQAKCRIAEMLCHGHFDTGNTLNSNSNRLSDRNNEEKTKNIKFGASARASLERTHRLLGDYVNLLNKKGPSCKLLGFAVDNRAMGGFIAVILTAVLSQVLRLAFTK